jgi:hypothetical protein
MPSQYNGQGGNTLISLLPSIGIASTTATNPVTITTFSAHGMTTGDMASISGVTATNSVVNGQWFITVTGPTTFTIPVVGIGVTGGGGQVQPLALGATYSIPSDGDNGAAASVDVALEALGDRTAFLGTRLGAYKTVAEQIIVVGADHWNPANFGSGYQPTVAPMTWTFGGSGIAVMAADRLAIDADLVIAIGGPAGAPGVPGFTTNVALFAEAVLLGGSPTYAQVAGSTRNLPLTQTAGAVIQSSIHLSCEFSPASGVQGGTVNVQPQLQTPATMVSAFILADGFVRMRLLRPTGMPQ